jgi:hypothetical protein
LYVDPAIAPVSILVGSLGFWRGTGVPSRSMDRRVAILAAGQEDLDAISVRHRRR